ncbi:MAG: hypothetical protein PVF08_04340, partial [Gammaproteobacteria bacterium]
GPSLRYGIHPSGDHPGQFDNFLNPHVLYPGAWCDCCGVTVAGTTLSPAGTASRSLPENPAAKDVYHLQPVLLRTPMLPSVKINTPCRSSVTEVPDP